METGTHKAPITAEIHPELEARQNVFARIGNTVRNGYEHVQNNLKTYAAVGAVAFTGAKAAELVLDATPVGADNVSTPAQAQSIRQDCIDVALEKPKVVKALVLHAGKFEPEPEQRFSLTTEYKQQMPEECTGLYARGNQAKAQVWHNGKWMDASYWHSVSILRYSDRGTWYDLGNERGIDFPICKARIMLKANATDLSYDSGKVWAPHRSIAKKIFPPIPAKLLPHKPKPC